MTALELMAMAEPLAKLYIGLETDLMANIAMYIATQSLESSTAQWKMKKLADLGALNKTNIKTIAAYSAVLPDMVEIAVTSAALSAVSDYATGFKEMVQDGIINGTVTSVSDTMAKTLKTYVKQATTSCNLVNTVMQYKAKTVASKLINDTAELANKQEFLDSLNKATGKVVTGAQSRQAALRQCIGEMTAKGIPAFTDKLGREWSPEAYINMDIRTTCANVAHQTQFDYLDAYDIKLIEVSSHMGARPKCAKDQGRIFDTANKSTKYAHWSSSSYGDADGLLGINCRHQIYPFVDGVNTQTYFPYDEEKNAKAYKLSQQQRQLERNVRSSKRECTSLDTLGDKDGFEKASVKLKAKEAKLKSFCKDNDLPYRSDRTAVSGYNRSVSAKAVAANKRALQKEVDKVKQNDIINLAKSLDIKGSAIYKPSAMNISDFKFDDDHINNERNHNINLTQATSYMNNAVVSITRYNGNSVNYYSNEGAVYIRKDTKTIRTAFSSDEYDEKTLEFMKGVNTIVD